ncbi:hypothetical protein CDL12_00728 [Handroanthus impetiginosus]|uniref:Nucleotidyltransferase n=1 Tax=Handroanthus impetiginosus TaxID=429701 RepID=A0A2G9I9U1_9LAMI|nr:hypothetical protein CDL12_00728 [Handroanthus impetiginosus]
MNTWERHRRGHRPDAPWIGSWHVRSSTPDSPHGFGNSNSDNSGKRVTENSYAHGMEGENITTHDVPSRYDNNASRVRPMTSELSAAPHTHSLKSQFNLNRLQVTDQVGNDTITNDELQRDVKADHLANDKQGRFLFARTRSSPELTDNYSDVSSQVQRNRQAETADAHATYSRLDSSNRRKNLGSESLASHSSHSSVEDISSVRNVAPQQSLDAADSKSISSSYHWDLGLNASSEEFSTTSGAQTMHQEEQDIVNMMASASLQGFNGQVHFPFNLTSGHQPYSIPAPFLASMGYTQRNMPGFVPTNIPLMDPSFSHMQFPHALVAPQLTHYFPGIGLNSSDDSVDRSNENLGPVEMNSGEVDNDFWQEQDVSSSGRYDPENGNFDTLESDDKPALLSGLKYVPPPSRAGSSGSATRIEQNHPGEKCGTVPENSGSTPSLRSSEVCADERSASSRFSSATHSNSLRSRTSSESSWDGSSQKGTNSTKGKRGKNIIPADLTASHGRGKLMSEHLSNDADDDDDEEWGSLNVETEMVERNPGSDQVAHLQVPRQHIPGFEVAQTSGSDSMIPFAPMLIGPGSRPKTNDNSGLIAFYPTGPPIPFLAMLPLYNIPPETGISDASSGHFGGDETLDNSDSGVNFNSKGFDRTVDLNSSSPLRGTSTIEKSNEQKSDILNSDFASHWQNLQFGRFCQNPPLQEPLLYPSPVMVPPYYVQGRFPYDNAGRPVSANTNLFSQLVTSYGNGLVPGAPFQSVSSRQPNMYQSYMDDMPRYRSGTGTYLPNPKISVRERHSSGSRRGNYNHDRNDSFGERDGNWNASKSRAAARSHSRNQTDNPNSKTDRFTHSGGRADRLGNSYRHNSIPSYQLQNGPLHSNSSQNGPQNVAYSMYPLAATNPGGSSNGPSVPPVMMLYPFDHNGTYGSYNEQLEFGSLGPVGFQGTDEQSQLNNETRARAVEDHRHGTFVNHSSPDQPSSPRHQRRH